MVIRGTRTSLARARMIRSARRSRSGKMFSRRTSGNTSSRLNSSSRTNSTSETKQTKQIALYEEVQKVADDMQKTAKALLELGTAKTETAAKTDSATTSESREQTDSNNDHHRTNSQYRFFVIQNPFQQSVVSCFEMPCHKRFSFFFIIGFAIFSE